MGLDQGNQTLPRHHLIHLDQEQLPAGLLALAAYLASAKDICFIGKLRSRWGRAILPNQKVFFRVSLSALLSRPNSDGQA